MEIFAKIVKEVVNYFRNMLHLNVLQDSEYVYTIDSQILVKF